MRRNQNSQTSSVFLCVMYLTFVWLNTHNTLPFCVMRLPGNKRYRRSITSVCRRFSSLSPLQASDTLCWCTLGVVVYRKVTLKPFTTFMQFFWYLSLFRRCGQLQLKCKPPPVWMEFIHVLQVKSKYCIMQFQCKHIFECVKETHRGLHWTLHSSKGNQSMRCVRCGEMRCDVSCLHICLVMWKCQ